MGIIILSHPTLAVFVRSFCGSLSTRTELHTSDELDDHEVKWPQVLYSFTRVYSALC
jgi:hypothetical protein